MRKLSTVALAALLTMVPLPAAGAEQPARPHCGPAHRLHVPGAPHQEVSCLADLTTRGTARTGHTDPADWAGLTQAALPVPDPVPGTQIDGYFRDDSSTNTNHGWAHDSQFVIRLPRDWNGGLVISGSPGNREQYANDRAISDWALSRGYAFAATDKGNTGLEFYRDGDRPGDAIAEWNRRVTQLAIAAKVVAAQRYHRLPRRTIATGISNGGYLVRWQLENRPWLYDGGVDWEGTLWSQDGPNLDDFLPVAIEQYPRYADGGPDAEEARAAMFDAGFAAGSEFLWPYHHEVYWGLTERIYRQELDPEGDGAADALRRIGLTGRIGKPLLTVHGTLDALLPIRADSDVYARMVRSAGRGELHRYYRIEDGNHTDGLVDRFPDRLRGLAPCHRSAFEALEALLSRGVQPPESATIPRPPDATPAELVTRCDLS